MPSFHRYIAARIDARRIDNVEQIDRLRDAVRGITGQNYGGYASLKEQLSQLATEYPTAELDILLFEPDYVSWQLWSVRGGETRQEYVGFCVGNRDVELNEDMFCAKIELGSNAQAQRIADELSALGCEDVESPDERSIDLPIHWSSPDQLRKGLALIAPQIDGPIQIAALIDDEPWLAQLSRGGVELVQPSPTLDDRERTELVRKLWGGGVIELGTERVEALGRPDPQAPLTRGHRKAREVALVEIAKRRSVADLPALLDALSAPANAGPEFAELRKKIYQAITWFDVPEVRQAVRRGLQTEPPDVLDTLRYVIWRLPGADQA